MTRFKPGISGNPKGRPQGALSIRTKRRAAMSEYTPQLVEAIKLIRSHGDVEDFRRQIGQILRIR